MDKHVGCEASCKGWSYRWLKEIFEPGKANESEEATTDKEETQKRQGRETQDNHTEENREKRKEKIKREKEEEQGNPDAREEKGQGGSSQTVGHKKVAGADEAPDKKQGNQTQVGFTAAGNKKEKDQKQHRRNTSRQEMHKAIRENLYSRRSEAREEAWGYREDWSSTKDYPMQKRETFQLEKEEGRGGGNMVKWKPLTAWFRQTGVGPEKMRDRKGRRRITIFMQPKGNHNCRTMLFSGCWQCWATNCRTCQYMYENGAERWGPGACDRCTDLDAYAETEENSRYQAKKGTNEPDGWNKRDSIKWVWIYDKNSQTNPPGGEGEQKKDTERGYRDEEEEGVW